MSLRCLFGVHRPLLTSIVHRKHGYAALCEDCARPLERSETGRWAPPPPLTAPIDRVA